MPSPIEVAEVRHCLRSRVSSGNQAEHSLRSPTRVTAFLSSLLFLLTAATSRSDPAAIGQWSPVTAWPYKAVHASLLSNGKVFYWPKNDNPQVWDPVSNSTTAAAKSGANIFCSGHSFLPGGQLLVTGGHIQSYVGLSTVYTYSPSTDVWRRLPDMNDGRWYPTRSGFKNV